jgi:hypothetical protein
MSKRIPLETMLKAIGNGWYRSDVVELKEGEWVKNPASAKGRDVFGPAKVQLEVAPDGGRRLYVDEH